MNLLEQAWWALAAELSADFADVDRVVRFVVRLSAAVACGGVLGWEREHMGKAAGMRTHMLVALGAAVVVLVGELGNFSGDGASRVIQGTITGVGFIGGGAILKLSEQGQVKGLTTAATVWVAATAGIAAGSGRLGLAAVATLLALGILIMMHRLELRRLNKIEHPH